MTRESRHNPVMSIVQYAAAIAKLSDDDRDELGWAARNNTSVMDGKRPMFVEQGLVYRKTGKVRPLPAKLLTGKIEILDNGQ